MNLVLYCDPVHLVIRMTIMTRQNSVDPRLRDLRVLNVVLRENNLTRAAEVLKHHPALDQ